MNKLELAKKVDLAFQLDKKIKDAKKKLDPLKKELKEIAEAKGSSELHGEKVIAKVGPSTATGCTSDDLLEVLTDMARADEFPSLVKVKITEAKAALGEETFASIATSDTTPFSRLSFKPK